MYSTEFVEKCKRVYPDSRELGELLETNSMLVGRLLDCSASTATITPEEILEAKSLEEIKRKALVVLEKQNLYVEWMQIVQHS